MPEGARQSFWVVRPTDPDHRVTPLELLFDLIFVFAITQVTTLLAREPTWSGVGHAGLLLALLWGPWMGFAWLGNIVRADEAIVRAGLIGALTAVFVLALAIPHVFRPEFGEVLARWLMVVAYLLVRLVHLGVFWVVGRGEPDVERQLRRFAVPLAVDCSLMLAGVVLQGYWLVPLWGMALATDYIGTLVIGADGWRLRSPGHFAERHGLIVLVALGESVVAAGSAVSQPPFAWPMLLAVTLGLLVTLNLWWAYFHVVAAEAEVRLRVVSGRQRLSAARDAYSYLHLPMVAGIVFLAFGLRQTLTLVARGGGSPLRTPLSPVAAAALLGGVSLYLAAHAVFRRRLGATAHMRQVVVALVIAAAAPAAVRTPALLTLAGLAGVLLALSAYDYVRLDAAGRLPRPVAESVQTRPAVKIT